MMTLRAVVISALLSSFMVSVLAHSAAADTLLVSNRGDATVQLIDTETGETVSTIKAGVGAHEFAVSPDGRVIVGSCYGSGGVSHGGRAGRAAVFREFFAEVEPGVADVKLAMHDASIGHIESHVRFGLEDVGVEIERGLGVRDAEVGDAGCGHAAYCTGVGVIRRY